jgi:ABC-type branched-subunit amino acid transport system permease subunit
VRLASATELSPDLATGAMSGVYGFLLVIIMLLRPEGLLPERHHEMSLRH